MTPIKVTDETFDQDVLASKKPVLVSFEAEWAGPCRLLAPVLDEVAEDIPGLVIAKVNIEESPLSADKHAVKGVPTLMLFRDGKMVHSRIGALTRDMILDWMEEKGV